MCLLTNYLGISNETTHIRFLLPNVLTFFPFAQIGKLYTAVAFFFAPIREPTWECWPNLATRSPTTFATWQTKWPRLFWFFSAKKVAYMYSIFVSELALGSRNLSQDAKKITVKRNKFTKLSWMNKESFWVKIVVILWICSALHNNHSSQLEINHVIKEPNEAN